MRGMLLIDGKSARACVVRFFQAINGRTNALEKQREIWRFRGSNSLIEQPRRLSDHPILSEFSNVSRLKILLRDGTSVEQPSPNLPSAANRSLASLPPSSPLTITLARSSLAPICRARKHATLPRSTSRARVSLEPLSSSYLNDKAGILSPSRKSDAPPSTTAPLLLHPCSNTLSHQNVGHSTKVFPCQFESVSSSCPRASVGSLEV